MKLSIFAAFILACCLPALLFSVVGPEEQTESARENIREESTDPSEKSESITVLTDNGTVQLELEEYIACVVLAEMPADFEVEALKAQAVVTRTYTRRKQINPKHDTASVCTASSCCQAYITPEEYLKNGGTEESIEKVSSSVEATAGEVLVYNGELIEATYFSCSGGKTEDAQAVWGTEVPYLQSVESPGEERASHFTDSVSFSSQEFCEKLGVSISGNPGTWIGPITYTDGGGVATVQIGEVSFTGTQIRQKLGLRSTAFVITGAGDGIIITTKGFGHRVGMSQYGAEAMAVQGQTYDNILYHYYQGTSLKKASG